MARGRYALRNLQDILTVHNLRTHSAVALKATLHTTGC